MTNSKDHTREEDKRFTLRIERELFKKVEEQAQIDRRSVGREIEAILAAYFESKNKYLSSPDQRWSFHSD